MDLTWRETIISGHCGPVVEQTQVRDVNVDGRISKEVDTTESLEEKLH